jgi:hypothetical protein
MALACHRYQSKRTWSSVPPMTRTNNVTIMTNIQGRVDRRLAFLNRHLAQSSIKHRVNRAVPGLEAIRPVRAEDCVAELLPTNKVDSALTAMVDCP